MVSILFVTAMVASLVGCGKQKEVSDKAPENSVVEQEDKQENIVDNIDDVVNNIDDVIDLVEDMNEITSDDNSSDEDSEKKEPITTIAQLEEKYCTESNMHILEIGFTEGEEIPNWPYPIIIVEDGTQDIEISDDLADFEFAFGGRKFTIPFDYTELKDLGYDCIDDSVKNTTLKPRTVAHGYYELANVDFWGDETFSFRPHVDLWNSLDEGVATGEELKVYKISFSLPLYGGKTADLKLPGGITWGSTVNEVSNVFGRPTDIIKTSYGYQVEQGQTLFYSKEGETFNHMIEVDFDDDGKAIRFEMYIAKKKK